MRGGTRHVIDEIGADALLSQFPDIDCGEMKMLSKAEEVINDRASRYLSSRESNDIGERERNAMLHFCIQRTWHTRLPESR